MGTTADACKYCGVIRTHRNEEKPCPLNPEVPRDTVAKRADEAGELSKLREARELINSHMVYGTARCQVSRVLTEVLAILDGLIQKRDGSSKG